MLRRALQSYHHPEEISLQVSLVLDGREDGKLILGSRSRAVQIGMNLAVLEEWIEKMELPPGVQLHFLPVRDLLNWLQVCIEEFLLPCDNIR